MGQGIEGRTTERGDICLMSHMQADGRLLPAIQLPHKELHDRHEPNQTGVSEKQTVCASVERRRGDAMADRELQGNGKAPGDGCRWQRHHVPAPCPGCRVRLAGMSERASDVREEKRLDE